MGAGLVEAMDPATGRTLWTQTPLVPGMDGLLGGGAHWGVAYWGQGSEARILTTRAQYLFALNPKTGQPIADFGDGGKVDLNVGLGPLMKAWNRTRRGRWRERQAMCARTTSARANCAGPST